MIDALTRAPLSAPLDERRRAIVRYAVKLTATPAQMIPRDVELLAAAGLTPRAILDINFVCGYYAFVNRLAQGLGVELEEFWRDEP